MAKLTPRGSSKSRSLEEISAYVNAAPDKAERQRRKQEVYVEAYSSPVSFEGTPTSWWQRAPTDDFEGGLP